MRKFLISLAAAASTRCCRRAGCRRSSPSSLMPTASTAGTSRPYGHAYGYRAQVRSAIQMRINRIRARNPAPCAERGMISRREALAA